MDGNEKWNKGKHLVITFVVIVGFILLINYVTTHWHTSQQTHDASVSEIPDIEKPKPEVGIFRGCPPEGDGGDPELNRLKNRIDEGKYIPLDFQAIATLPWPPGIENKHRSRWSREDREAIARYEGTPVVVEGYLHSAKLMGPESCNCHGADKEFRDFHLWFVPAPIADRTSSIVAEISPRVRINHPEWTTRNLNKLAKAQQKVRISGWLLLDPEHPEEVGKTRATIWEIHPIMRLEVEVAGRWKTLDELPS